VTPDRWRRVRDLFDQALDLPVSERHSFLMVSTNGDRELVHEVESLLQSFRESDDLMAEPAAAALGNLVSDLGQESPEGARPAEATPVFEHCDENYLSIGDRLAMFLRLCETAEKAPPGRLSREKFRLAPDGRLELYSTGPQAAAPDHFSPEEASGLTITTASAVYSLGTALYFLLTGRSPYFLRHRTAPALLSAIRHEPVLTPSARVSADESFVDFDGWTRTWNAKELSARRGESVAGLGKRLQGDLDAIVLTALEKDPSRRYASPSLLAEDVKRHIEGRPVLVREQTFLYRASKLVQRGLRRVEG
jgi:serine/threonine protein kinase